MQGTGRKPPKIHVRLSTLSVCFSRCDDHQTTCPTLSLRRMSSSEATPLATSQTTVAKDARNQSVFPAGNGRFFASVRTGGSTRFLGTFNSAVDANSAVASFTAKTGAKLEPNFQFY